MKVLRFISCVAAALLAGTAARAQMVPDAKTLGMGSVTMAAIDTTHPIYNNPASVITATAVSQLSTSYYSQSKVDYYAISGYYALDTRNILEAGWTRSTLSDHKEMHFSAGYVRRPSDHWGFGITGHYIRYYEGAAEQNAIACDLSTLYTHPFTLFGRYASLRAGGKLGYIGAYTHSRGDLERYMPVTLSAGAAISSHLSDTHAVTLGADIGQCFVPSRLRAFTFSAGAEYSLMQLLQFRVGYQLTDRIHADPIGQATVGIGARFMHLRFDGSYIFGKDRLGLDDCFCLSFGLDF